ncbi:MAG: ABC transporter ATP-binding protein [Acidobacteriota bacterium]|jgi:lipoprotein-releasing system ATP-binding protein
MSPASPFSLNVVGVRKSFETGPHLVDVLEGITFSLSEGSSLAVTGPSGSGKSTLLHLIGTLEPPTAGTIEIGGRDPYTLPEPELAAFRNRTIGFVFQDAHLLPQYSVLENVLLPTMAFPRQEDAGAMEKRARVLLEKVGLEHRLDHVPSELSGGERQRAAVARALIHAPRLLLCDEPTGSLDATSADAVADLLFELHREENNILVTVTHAEALAARFPQRFRLVDGRCAAA